MSVPVSFNQDRGPTPFMPHPKYMPGMFGALTLENIERSEVRWKDPSFLCLLVYPTHTVTPACGSIRISGERGSQRTAASSSAVSSKEMTDTERLPPSGFRIFLPLSGCAKSSLAFLPFSVPGVRFSDKLNNNPWSTTVPKFQPRSFGSVLRRPEDLSCPGLDKYVEIFVGPGSSSSSLLHFSFGEMFSGFSDVQSALICFSGGHTIGISHCPAVSRRLYNSTGPGRIDPTMDSEYVENLKILATTHSCSKEGEKKPDEKMGG
ncbi:hypothetical protein GOBAR_DD04965 [Gossypium barbadense]|nr:hypothetical protein GOBAR_DD04965 [Gossypium barbadense]